ncbi:MAG: WbqC family protein [Bacteroidales bacterium]
MPLTYFGPISWWTILRDNKDNIIFDIHHNYVKQTYRNRCSIQSSNGKLNLSIPITKTFGNHTPFKDIKIDKSQNWQRIHIKSIKSAYKSSPYYDYLIEEIIYIWEKKYNFLIDVCLDSLEGISKLLKLDLSYILSSEYIDINDNTSKNYTDLRYVGEFNNYLNYPLSEYTQVFSDRFYFMNDLSILDKLFNINYL